jgi:sphingolipid delta-4 desaturase
LYFNFGLHLEHHDLMGIPWSRLGRLREIAPEFYDDLIITKSYRSLAMKFVMGNPQSLEAQFTRQDEVNKERLQSAEVDDTTDAEAISEQQPEQIPIMQ